MATRLYEQRGWSPWPSCSRTRGLHATTVERPWAGNGPPRARRPRAPATAGGIAVAGWAFDRDTHPSRIEVHAYVDGRGTLACAPTNERGRTSRRRTASASTTASPAVVPAGPGRHHGLPLRASTPAAARQHRPRLQGRDRARSAPIGAVERSRSSPAASASPAGRSTSTPPRSRPSAHVHVDGQGRGERRRRLAPPRRRPAPTACPRPAASTSSCRSGSEVCAFAIDTTGRADNTLLDCAQPPPDSQRHRGRSRDCTRPAVVALAPAATVAACAPSSSTTRSWPTSSPRCATRAPTRRPSAGSPTSS